MINGLQFELKSQQVESTRPGSVNWVEPEYEPEYTTAGMRMVPKKINQITRDAFLGIRDKNVLLKKLYGGSR